MRSYPPKDRMVSMLHPTKRLPKYRGRRSSDGLIRCQGGARSSAADTSCKADCCLRTSGSDPFLSRLVCYGLLLLPTRGCFYLAQYWNGDSIMNLLAHVLRIKIIYITLWSLSREPTNGYYNGEDSSYTAIRD